MFNNNSIIYMICNIYTIYRYRSANIDTSHVRAHSRSRSCCFCHWFFFKKKIRCYWIRLRMKNDRCCCCDGSQLIYFIQIICVVVVVTYAKNYFGYCSFMISYNEIKARIYKFWTNIMLLMMKQTKNLALWRKRWTGFFI